VTGTTRAAILAAGWAAALTLLALEWTRTPLSGPGPAFLIWSLPALPLAALSWRWLRAFDVRQVRIPPAAVAAIVLGWIAVAALTASGVGSEWALDGLILRNAVQQWAGVGVWWLPGMWGAALSVAGLAAALEARYRLAHPTRPT
jgi:hypothetical protein